MGVLETIGLTFDTRQDLPSLLASSEDARSAWQVGIGLPAAGLLAWFVLRDRASGRSTTCSPVSGSAASSSQCWYVSGHLGYVEEHPQTLEQAFLRTNSRQMESLSFVAPVGPGRSIT